MSHGRRSLGAFALLDRVVSSDRRIIRRTVGKEIGGAKGIEAGTPGRHIERRSTDRFQIDLVAQFAHQHFISELPRIKPSSRLALPRPTTERLPLVMPRGARLRRRSADSGSPRR